MDFLNNLRKTSPSSFSSMKGNVDGKLVSNSGLNLAFDGFGLSFVPNHRIFSGPSAMSNETNNTCAFIVGRPKSGLPVCTALPMAHAKVTDFTERTHPISTKGLLRIP